MQRSSLIAILVFVSLVSTSVAQNDSTLVEVANQEYNRKPIAEWVFGNIFTFINGSATEYSGDYPLGTYEGEETRNYFVFGVSGHIPLATLGRTSTLWLVPSLLLSINTGSSSDYNSFSGTSHSFIDVNVPIHVCYGFGGLQKKAVAWGFEAGLGINIAGRLAEETVTVQPSALVEVSYTPKSVYRLQIMADLLPATLTGPAGEYTRRSITVAVILAI